jgi:hypothetical protein
MRACAAVHTPAQGLKCEWAWPPARLAHHFDAPAHPTHKNAPAHRGDEDPEPLPGLGVDLLANALPNLGCMYVVSALLAPPLSAAAAFQALTSLYLHDCRAPVDGEHLLLSGVAPRLRVLTATHCDAQCTRLVLGHPALQEFECHGFKRGPEDAGAWLAAACAVQGLVRLSLNPTPSAHDNDMAPVPVPPDMFIAGIFTPLMRLPLQLRSLTLTLDNQLFAWPPRMQPVLGVLAGALGDRLTELRVYLRYYEGDASDALLCLPMFVRLESITLGTWAPFDARHPARLANFRALLTRFRSVRAGMPSLRAATFEVAHLDDDAPHDDPGEDPFDALCRDFPDICIEEQYEV